MREYRNSMQYLRIVFAILMLFVVITFCVNNIQAFTLSFLGYRIMVPLQLWTLMVIFFVAGMVPIIAIELPRHASHCLRMRAIKSQIRQEEEALRQLGGSPGEPAK
jgi:uncharacterized integral membrane protein